jgi:chemotaxis response regulator CheB
MKWSAGASRGCCLRTKAGRFCGDAPNSEEVLKQAEELHPDVILRDVSLPSIDGLETTRLATRRLPDTKVLITSQHDPHHPYVMVELCETQKKPHNQRLVVWCTRFNPSAR